MSAVSVALGENTESFEKAYGVLDKNALTGNRTVFPALLLCQRVVFGTLFGQAGIGVQISKSQIPGIRLQQCIRQDMSAGFLEEFEIMLLPVGKSQRNDLPVLQIHQQLCL